MADVTLISAAPFRNLRCCLYGREASVQCSAGEQCSVKIRAVLPLLHNLAGHHEKNVIFLSLHVLVVSVLS